MGRRKRLGDILRERGLLTDEELGLALERQRETGEKLGEALINLGFISPENIADALSEHLGIPRVDFKRRYISSDVAATARTDHDGCFEKSGLTGGYYVTAQKDGWSFAPDSILVTSATDSINFYGAYVQESYGASGRITYDGGNQVPAVVVTFTFLDSDRPDVYTTTDKNGTWSFEGLVGRVRVIPTKPGHVFTPGSQEIEGETINLNFWARTE